MGCKEYGYPFLRPVYIAYENDSQFSDKNTSFLGPKTLLKYKGPVYTRYVLIGVWGFGIIFFALLHFFVNKVITENNVAETR